MNLYQQKGHKGLAILLTAISIIPAAYVSFPMLTGMDNYYAPSNYVAWASFIGLTAVFAVIAYSFTRTLCWVVNGFEDKGGPSMLLVKEIYKDK